MRALPALLAVLAFAIGTGNALGEGVEPTEGGYRGRTGQRLPVRFRVSEGAVFDARFSVRHWGPCSPLSSDPDTGTSRIDKAGRFSVDDGLMAIRGSFVAPRRVTGTILFRALPSAGCPRVEVQFVAHARRQGPNA